DAARARDRAAYGGLHPLGSPARRSRGGGRAGAPHRSRVAQRQGAPRDRDRRSREPRRAAGARDRGGPPRSHPHRAPPGGDRARSAVVAEAPHRARTAWRRWGYRLLPGDTFSYILHLRPAEWPIMAGHTALGYLLAVGLKGAGSGEQLPAALAALAIWVICLNGGTLAINSVFDKDEGDIGYLIAPPPIPKHLLAFCPLFAGLYPLTQLYQFDEDRRRGDRTLALILGMRTSLGLAIACILAAFALFLWAGAVLGVGAWAGALGVPLALWLGVLV